MTDCERLHCCLRVVQRVRVSAVGSDVHLAIGSGHIAGHAAGLYATDVAGCHTLNRQRVAVLVSISYVAAAAAGRCDIARDGAGVKCRHPLIDRGRVGLGNGQTVDVDDDGAGGAQASTVALVLASARRAAARDIAVLVVDRHVQRDAVVGQIARRGYRIAVSDAAQCLVDLCSARAAAKCHAQHAARTRVSANRRARQDHVARGGAQAFQIAAAAENVIRVGRCVTAERQGRAGPTALLRCCQFLIEQGHIRIDQHRVASLNIRTRQRRIHRGRIECSDGRRIVHRRDASVDADGACRPAGGGAVDRDVLVVGTVGTGHKAGAIRSTCRQAARRAVPVGAGLKVQLGAGCQHQGGVVRNRGGDAVPGAAVGRVLPRTLSRRGGVAGDGNTGQCRRRRSARDRNGRRCVGRIRVQARGVDQAGDGGTGVAGRCDVFGHAGQCGVAAGDWRVVDGANRGAKRHRGSADGGGATVVGCIGQVGAGVARAHRGRVVDQAHCERAGYAVEVARRHKAQAVGTSHQQWQCRSGTAHRSPARTVVVLPDALPGRGAIAHNGDACQRVGAGAAREGVGAVVEARRKEVADGVARHRASCDVFGYRCQR